MVKHLLSIMAGSVSVERFFHNYYYSNRGSLSYDSIRAVSIHEQNVHCEILYVK